MKAAKTTSMAAHRHLIRHAIQNEWTIQCEDHDTNWCDEKTVEFTSYKPAIDHIEAVDGGMNFHLIKRSTDIRVSDQSIWVCLAIGYGNQPDETVADFTVHPFIDAWFEQYCREYVAK